MIVGIFHRGSGLGNQLFRYVATRVLAQDKGYEFGMINPKGFLGSSFMELDMGNLNNIEFHTKEPEGKVVPNIDWPLWEEKRIVKDGIDIRSYDPEFNLVKDNTIVDGEFQGEKYIVHRKNEIREWLKVKEEYECYDYSDDNTCVINFRGGEYVNSEDLFLNKNYWGNAINNMLKINSNFRFIVITDDVATAKEFFPNYDVSHFSTAKDYVIIKNAKYLILSNSSFAWFPAWLNVNLKYCIAPKYWSRHNISDGYWSMSYNITSGWMYQDREGKLSDYETCIKESEEYIKSHGEFYNQTEQEIEKTSFLTPIRRKIANMFSYKTRRILKKILNAKKVLLFFRNDILNFIDYIKQPFYATKLHLIKKTWLSKKEIENYRENIKIYDIFLFFNELELLEIRLNILDKYVDYFVIIESTETFTGLPKKLYFEENKHLFEKWKHKILHYVVKDTPKNEEDLKTRLSIKDLNPLDREIVICTLNTDNVPDKKEVQWLKEFYQKEATKRILTELNDDDFCYISDLDEIWNPEIIIDYSKDDIYKYRQTAYIYYLNNRSNENWRGWVGTIGTKYKNIKNSSINHIRTPRKNKFTVLWNGGWHFSFQGGENKIVKKLEAYSHQEINTSKIKSQIKNTISENRDIRGRHIKFWNDESKLPKYLLENKEKYSELFRK